MSTVSAGEIVWVDLDPTVGHEQRGHRPVLVISATVVNKSTAIVVPLTTSDRPRPVKHEIRGTGRRSYALADQVRTLDLRGRTFQRKGRAHPADLAAVRTMVGRLIEVY